MLWGGVVSRGVMRCNMVWCCVVVWSMWCSVVWCGGVVWCAGVVWCGVVRCSVPKAQFPEGNGRDVLLTGIAKRVRCSLVW